MFILHLGHSYFSTHNILRKHLSSAFYILSIIIIITSSCCCLLFPATLVGSSISPSTGFYPSKVRIGALVPFNTTSGAFTLEAIRLAVQDVNDTPNVMPGRELVIEILDSGCDPVLGAASAMELLKRDVVAVIGPQSSAISQFVAEIAREVKVPFVSFGATDPNLSATEYPYFIRVAPSDALQVNAIVAFIVNYGWREVVIFHMDDNYGTNGASKLVTLLQDRGSKLVHRIPVVPWIEKTTICALLAQLANKEARIFVLHTHPDVGFRILQEAQNQQMLEYDYVWIVTDLIANHLGEPHANPTIPIYTQGIIGTRRYIADSSQLHNFMIRIQNQLSLNFPLNLDQTHMNIYGLYAYDAVWAVAHAISLYFTHQERISFLVPVKIPTISGGESELAKMRVFEGGPVMRDCILKTSFMGITGAIEFDKVGDLMGGTFEYVNMVGKNPHIVGYWGWRKDHGNLYRIPPQTDALNPLDISSAEILSHDGKPTKQIPMPIIWPGKVTKTPHGWVVPKSGKAFKIAVPWKAGYTQLVQVAVNEQNQTSIKGFCIEVFEASLKYLPYAMNFDFEIIGNGETTPMYGDIVQKLANQEYDALVGDVTILADRLMLVDFTQPYMDSALVLLVPTRDMKGRSPWDFLKPFTSSMWTTVLLLSLFTGLVIWMLERNVNEEFQGPPKIQLIILLTFIFSTLVSSQTRDTRSFLGRIVLIIWLFVILIINSSYTANLTSILTVEKLQPSIESFEILLRTDLPIGYQAGSFVKNYLLSLNVNPSRLKPFSSRQMYAKALDDGPGRGGVAAIVDELPYIQLLQAVDCKKYTIVGQEFIRTGWGFAFPHESGMTDDVSQAILKMSEEGELQRIQDSWFMKSIECEEGTSSASNSVQSTQLGISSFWGLFLVSAGASSVCALLHLISLLKKYRTYRQEEGERTSIDETAICFLQHLKQFLIFADMASNKQLKRLEGKEDDEQSSTSSVSKDQRCSRCSCCCCCKRKGVATSSSSPSKPSSSTL